MFEFLSLIGQLTHPLNLVRAQMVADEVKQTQNKQRLFRNVRNIGVICGLPIRVLGGKIEG